MRYYYLATISTLLVNYNIYSMSSEFTLFPQLNKDLRGHIFVYSNFFQNQLKRHRVDTKICDPCEPHCFVHRLGNNKRVDEITDTLQLALSNSYVDDAMSYVVWYELGRIRKNPALVQIMQEPDDWKKVLFSYNYIARQEQLNQEPRITASEVKKEIPSISTTFLNKFDLSLHDYQTPTHAHLQLVCFKEINKTVQTASNDFSILLSPTISIKTDEVTKPETYSLCFCENDQTLVQHAIEEGWSTGYSLQTQEKKWHVTGPKNYHLVTCNNSTCFPIVRAGKEGIIVIENTEGKNKKIYQDAVDSVGLSKDNSIVAAWGKDDTIVVIDINDTIQRSFDASHIFSEFKQDPEVKFKYYYRDGFPCRMHDHGLYADPTDVSKIIIYKSFRFDGDRKIKKYWRSVQISKNNGGLQFNESRFDKKIKRFLPRPYYINNWNQHGNQFVSSNPVVWREKNPSENTTYHTLKFNYTDNKFYYIEADSIDVCHQEKGIIFGMRNNYIHAWRMLPSGLSPSERLIMEATQSYSNRISNSASKTYTEGFYTNTATRLCKTLEISSDNKDHIAQLSKIIKDNIVIPSALEAINRSSMTRFLTYSMGISLLVSPLFFKKTFSYVGLSAYYALGSLIMHRIHKWLLIPSAVYRRYVDFAQGPRTIVRIKSEHI